MISRFFAAVLTKLVRGYQLVVSPWFAPTCRYYPSCSQYAIDALKEHGPVRGTGMAVWRLLRCNPWSKGGVDHVSRKNPTRNQSQVDEAAMFDSSTARSSLHGIL